MEISAPAGQPSSNASRRYVAAFLALFGGSIGASLISILLVDPFGISPIALPLHRALVSTQRYMYPQVIRSHRFDSIIVGTSTTMLLDPELLNGPFQARFANVAMASATAWEQTKLIELFLREVKRPRAVVIGLDSVWCAQDADRNRITARGFPDWLYDDVRWNDYVHLLNPLTFVSAVRLARFNVGLYSPTTRSDGLDRFLPPDADYDLKRALPLIYNPGTLGRPTGADPAKFDFPALRWLDEILSRLPAGTFKVLAFMPVHAVYGNPPEVEACKAQITEIGRGSDASVIDWRISSSITREDTNYWDALHYRVSIATRVAYDLSAAALSGKESDDQTYRLLNVPQGH